jgi:two-component system, chemotaxis family, protein-glutamate methylesterase/glutaminase
MRAPLRVVVVNDSATMRASLRAALALTPELTIVAEARDGAEAVALVERQRPSVVLMDVVMPNLDGYAATRAIMARSPTPIVMVSAVVDPRSSAVIFATLEAGALCVAEAPPPPSDPEYSSRARALAQLLRAMAEVDVTRGALRAARSSSAPPPPRPHALHPPTVAAVGVVASTGGPGTLAAILEAVPLGALPPILVVQHIAAGFASSFATWLGERTRHPVEVARDGAPLGQGAVYVAPDDRHLGVSADLRVELTDGPLVGLFRPAGTYLLRSLARSLGPRALGVILTGMGDDGADGAAALRRAGGVIAAQDEATSVIYGMPRVALERGGVDDVMAQGEIAAWLCRRSGIS